MLSIRSFARAAPRTASRLTSSAIRRPASRPISLLQSAWKPARSQFAAAFSTSRIQRSSTELGEQADTELISKLKSELQVEAEMQSQVVSIPTSVKDYMENGPFEIIDTPGVEEVVLTRTYGEEKIRVTFSIADINAIDPEADYADRGMNDEEDANINQGDEKEFKVAPEDEIEESNEGVEGENDSYPVRVNVVVEKPGKGAITVEAAVQDGIIVIDSVYHFADASLAYAKTADKIHERQDLYVGPPFSNLDDELQLLFEAYLDVRGINTALTIFVPDYIEMKEQKEYVRWLENVKGFVEA